MVYVSANFGQVEYDIVANDRTKDGIDSAIGGVDDLGVHYSSTLTDIAFNFNMIQMAAQTAFGYLQEGWGYTVGAAITYADQMTQVSELTDMSIGDVERWRQTFIEMGANPDSMTMIFKQLETHLGETGDAGDKLRKRVSDLGVSLYDANGNLRDTSSIMQDLLPALDTLSSSDRDNLLNSLFGRNYMQDIELFKNGVQAAQDFQNAQPIVSDSDIDKAHRFGIELGVWSENLKNIGGAAGFDAINTIQHLDDITSNFLGVGTESNDQTSMTIGMTTLGGVPPTPKTPDEIAEEQKTEQEAVTKLTTAYSEWQVAIDNVSEAKQKLIDIQDNEAESIATSGGDVSKIRSAISTAASQKKSEAATLVKDQATLATKTTALETLAQPYGAAAGITINIDKVNANDPADVSKIVDAIAAYQRKQNTKQGTQSAVT